MQSKKEIFKNFPGVDTILNNQEIKELIKVFNKDFIVFSIRETLSEMKRNFSSNNHIPNLEDILKSVKAKISALSSRNLVQIFNASGIVIHTNLGRAPFTKDVIQEASEVLNGYNNLEFDLDKAQRGSRYTHVTQLLKYLSGAEDVLVVNNNAAAIMLILRAFSKNKEVIVSRGELIEIGGSFRLPEILLASDCKMVEVGTTNKTRIDDYHKNISEHTAILFKAHRSNYQIKGFTQEASLQELISLGKKSKIPVVYDMGSGLFDNSLIDFFKDEPDIKSTLKMGVDLLTFSGDKLLGGPQAGIIAGKKSMIAALKKDPMLRALRVGKLTLAYLETTCLQYLNTQNLFLKNYIYQMLNKSTEEINESAEKLKKALKGYHLSSEVVEGVGQFGGGSLPGKEIRSYAVWLKKESLTNNKERSDFAEKMYYGLLHHPTPVLGILKKGNIYFDLLSVRDEDISQIAKAIFEIFDSLEK